MQLSPGIWDLTVWHPNWPSALGSFWETSYGQCRRELGQKGLGCQGCRAWWQLASSLPLPRWKLPAQLLLTDGSVGPSTPHLLLSTSSAACKGFIWQSSHWLLKVPFGSLEWLEDTTLEFLSHQTQSCPAEPQFHFQHKYPGTSPPMLAHQVTEGERRYQGEAFWEPRKEKKTNKNWENLCQNHLRHLSMTKHYSYAAAAAQRVLISGHVLKALMQQHAQINCWEAYILIAEVLVRNMWKSVGTGAIKKNWGRMVSEQSLLKNGVFLPLTGTFQSCQLSCRIRNLTLQQSVFRFQAVQMTCLQGGISSMQESIAKQVKMPMSGGSRPNKTPQSARPTYWEDVREGDGKSCSLFESVQEMLCTIHYICEIVAWLYPIPHYRLIFHTPSVHTVAVLRATLQWEPKRAHFIISSPLNALQVTSLNFSQSEQLIRCKQIEKLYTRDNSFFKRPLI